MKVKRYAPEGDKLVSFTSRTKEERKKQEKKEKEFGKKGKEKMRAIFISNKGY